MKSADICSPPWWVGVSFPLYTILPFTPTPSSWKIFLFQKP
jgi:hypothetical protein